MTDKTRAEFEAAATAYREDRAKHDPAFLLTESERTFGWRMWQAALATKAAEPVVDEFCWLVELFEGDGTGNSAGWYHTGFVDIGGYSRTTKHAHEARRYATAAEAAQVAKKLGTTLTGTWKAVEHGFQAPPPPAPLREPDEAATLRHALFLVMNYPEVRSYLGSKVSDVADAALAAHPQEA